MLKFFKQIIKVILSRTFVLLCLFLLQIAFLLYSIYEIGILGINIYIIFLILSIIAAVFIINRNFNPAYKISWLIAIFALPFFGIFFYVLFGRLKVNKRSKKYLRDSMKETENFYKITHSDIDLKDKDFIKVSNYVTNTTSMPVFSQTTSQYLSPGEVAFPEIMKELKNAKKFIFMEFFILKYGKMWDEIHKVLKEKVLEGIEVRIIYDDFGCLNKLKNNFKKELRKEGIKVTSFNPIIPILSSTINYRDHRKIIVIDGDIGFTGGMNISDEYINEIEVFGYWKDSVIKIMGQGVYSLTYYFLRMWKRCSKENLSFLDYAPKKCEVTDGYVQVFGDGPFTQDLSTEMTYMQIINEANHYVYITTPYLILDNEVLTALKTAALSGVDVRIITPHIPDKKMVFMVTRSYYAELIKAGVKIYEYTPGFIHGKTIVSDDTLGIVGSANFDFRSLYLHYEISCLLYDASTIIDIKNDFLKTAESSHEVLLSETKTKNIFKKILVAILRAFSPMM